MRKTVLFFLLILGVGISLISKVEAYTIQEETVCIDKITEYSDKCVQIANSGNVSFKKGEYAKDYAYGEEQKKCINQIETYVNQHPACAEFGKQIIDGNRELFIKRMTLTNYMVDMACKKKHGKYSVGRTGLNLCDCMGGYVWENDQCIEGSSNQNIVVELQNAITWMYNNGLTSLKTISTFMGEDYLTREQASKFFVQFGKKVLGKVVDNKKEVKLGDLKKANGTLQSYIKEANQLGLFKGVNGKFLPFNKLTRAQAIAVIIRANNGQQNEKINPWYMGYYTIINNYGLLTGLLFDVNSLDSTNIKRKEVALLLYRLNNYILSDDSSIKLCQQVGGEFGSSNGVLNSSGAYDCTCKEGYVFSQNTNKCVTASKNCQENFGENSYSDLTMTDDSQYNCLCSQGYQFNEEVTQCISASQVGDQACQKDYGIYSYSIGTVDKDGLYDCQCKEGSLRSGGVDGTVCIKK